MVFHSLRATAATRLFKKFQEKVVCDTTGHRSTPVREYERSDQKLKIAASNVLLCNCIGNIKSNGTEISENNNTNGFNITLNINVNK